MAIFLTCYTVLDIFILQSKLNLFLSKYSDLFSCGASPPFLLHLADPIVDKKDLFSIEDQTKRYHMETRLLIANEFGMMEPRSRFSITVNDKSFPKISVVEMANLMRLELGANNIIVLHNGEVLI